MPNMKYLSVMVKKLWPRFKFLLTQIDTQTDSCETLGKLKANLYIQFLHSSQEKFIIKLYNVTLD